MRTDSLTPSNQQSQTNTSAAPDEMQGQTWHPHCRLSQRLSHMGFFERSKPTHHLLDYSTTTCHINFSENTKTNIKFLNIIINNNNRVSERSVSEGPILPSSISPSKKVIESQSTPFLALILENFSTRESCRWFTEEWCNCFVPTI